MSFLKTVIKQYGDELDKAGELVFIPATLLTALFVVIVITNCGSR